MYPATASNIFLQILFRIKHQANPIKKLPRCFSKQYGCLDALKCDVIKTEENERTVMQVLF